MASVVPVPPRAETTTVVSAKPLHGDPDSLGSDLLHLLPAREEVRMGRGATAGHGVNWITLIVMIAFHLGAIGALFFFSWQRLAVSAALYVLAINVGIGMCYHRLLTHRGYVVPRWIEYLMTLCATLALEGGPIFWVSTHRVHHQLSDHEGDPHTPREGGWWAHAGWMLFGRSLHDQTHALARYSPDLRKDKFHVWLSEYHWLTLVASGLLLLDQVPYGAVTLVPGGLVVDDHGNPGAGSRLLDVSGVFHADRQWLLHHHRNMAFRAGFNDRWVVVRAGERRHCFRLCGVQHGPQIREESGARWTEALLVLVVQRGVRLEYPNQFDILAIA